MRSQEQATMLFQQSTELFNQALALDPGNRKYILTHTPSPSPQAPPFLIRLRPQILAVVGSNEKSARDAQQGASAALLPLRFDFKG